VLNPALASVVEHGSPIERGERRTSVSILAEYSDPAGTSAPVMLVDISASGARIHTGHMPIPGTYQLHFGVYGRTYNTRFDVARVVEAGDDRYWGVHFLDLPAKEIDDLRRSVSAIAGDATYSLLDWKDISKEAESGLEEVLIGFTATGEEVMVPAPFALNAGEHGLQMFMDAHHSGRLI
jgi:hypothetical protein